MAYVPQEAWVQNMSVVDNVCFGQELDLPWLERVLEACALWPDVGSFPAGVHTQTGEQVRVSGPSWAREAWWLRVICHPDLWVVWWEGHWGGGREVGEKRGPAQSQAHSRYSINSY